MADIEQIWGYFEEIRTQNIIETPNKFNEYFCSCGGLKTFSTELPTCTSCGLQDFQFISDEPEWAGGPDEDGGDDPCRVGMAQDLHLYSEKWGMGTIMKGKNCQRMAKINFHSSMNHKDRALFHTYAEFDRICKVKLNLPEYVITEAKKTYRSFSEDKLTRGAVRKGIKANCVLQACVNNKIPRSTCEISQAFDIPVKDIARTIETFAAVTHQDAKESAGASDILCRIFNKLTCIPSADRGKIRMKLIGMCKDIEMEPKLMGKTPKGIVSAVLFIKLTELGYVVERSEIAAICEVSVPTLVKIENLIGKKSSL